MSKGIKLKDNIYLDSSGVTHNRVSLKSIIDNYISDSVTHIRKSLKEILNEGNLVKKVTISSATSTIDITGLDLVANGGIYKIFIYLYTEGTSNPGDMLMTLNGDATSKYNSFRTFNRKSSYSSGAGTYDSYANIEQGAFVIGDVRPGRLFMEQTLMIDSEVDNGTTNRLARLLGNSQILDGGGLSLLSNAGYYKNNVTTINRITISKTGGGNFVSGVVKIYKI